MHVLLTYLPAGHPTQPGHDLVVEARDICAALARHGIETTIATVEHDALECTRQGQNPRCLICPPLRIIPVTRLERLKLAALLQSNLSLLAEMFSLNLEGLHFDVVHSLSWEAGPAGALFSRLTGAALVWTIEDVIASRRPWLSDPLPAYCRQVERWLLRSRCRLICPDEYMRRKIMDLFLVPEERMTVIPPPAGAISGVVEEPGKVDNTSRVILFLGPRSATDPLKKLLRICGRLISERCPDLRLLLPAQTVSSDDMPVHRLIRQLGLAEHVVWLRKEIRWEEILRRMDLLVVPTRLEFPGNVILKAMAAGVPLMAAGGGALSCLLEDGVSYLKVSPDDVGGLSAAIEVALFDEKVRGEIITGARQKVRDQAEIGRKLRDIYLDAVAGSREPARKGGETGELRLSQSGGQGEV